ncbi:NAD(P)/FAD-dependent oxidoreductase [Nostoc sphaeroides]|uniref:Dehydrogenase n=1 Tax=Nostoc sphaeroides CCNUC1 TaxID=2653204 RepID=A0A5P8WC58_9NOSO|nr:FAD-dependent oxidoreductase [Nostoc sphaeroides]QFS50122.1 dehydrogenase [Nostoc sphaeroides CCNUC1]
MERLAIVGAGISGTPAGYYLQNQYDIHIYEQSNRVGGHANTIEVFEGDKSFFIDTAFVVFNKPNYPCLTQFFQDLNVETQKHIGGFNFYNLDLGIQFSSEEFDLNREEVEQNCNPDFLSLYDEANRFFTQCRNDFWEGKTRIPMKYYLDKNNFSQEFTDNFVMLMGSAVWSIPTDSLMDFPASTFISFFMTHDKGGLGGKSVEWETVTKGSSRYVEKVKSLLKRPIRTGEKVISIKRDKNQVIIKTATGEEVFDKVIIATHADQALQILEQPTDLERELLSSFKYHETAVTLHTDSAVMHPVRDTWKSWNYGQITRDEKNYTFVTYYSNMVHNFQAEKDYFVSLDTPPVELDQNKIIQVINYKHPEYDMNTLEAQKQLHKLNDTGPVYFSGTYFHIKKRGIDSYGFHESGIASALEIVNKLKQA